MMCYSVEPRDRIFVKYLYFYGFMSCAQNMGRNISKNISKHLSSKYSQKPLDHAKKCATDALKTMQFKKQQKQQVT